jgi:NDP-sugar pyrophosphorylase family protein
MNLPTVLILCHGRGLRLMSVTKGYNKCLLPLSDHTTILKQIVDSIPLTFEVVVTSRVGDEALFEAVALLPRSVGIHIIEPSGFLEDVLRLLHLYKDILIIESDIVSEDLDIAVGKLLGIAESHGFTVAGEPVSMDPRSIRVAQSRMSVIAACEDELAPRLSGIYRFRPEALNSIELFKLVRGGTFHDYIQYLCEFEISVCLIQIAIVFNVNWPSDYSEVVEWWGARTKQIAS